jgi:hypothetical protein
MTAQFTAKPKGRQPTNLTLSENARQMGEILAEEMHRPSLSNLVEHLILRAAAEAGLKSTPPPPPEGKE